MNIYSELSTSEYFKTFEKEFQREVTLEDLTMHFTADNNYHTEKPYLYRRIIKSSDRRFESFEIVHDKFERVHAIIFNLKIRLSELQDVFGKPLMQNEPYSESTVFAFKPTNFDIEIIKTRHPKWLTKIKESDYEYFSDNSSHTLVDPELSFVQFDIKKLAHSLIGLKDYP